MRSSGGRCSARRLYPAGRSPRLLCAVPERTPRRSLRHDLVDFVSREADRAGESAAEYALGQRRAGEEIVLRGTGGVRYTVPQKIAWDTMPASLTVRFRVAEPMRDRCIAVYSGKKRLLQKKKRVMAPGEMEFVILKKDSIPAGTKELTVCIEEA